MRSLIEGILTQVFEDQKEQVDATNRAIKNRVEETRNAKHKLEEHLSLVSQKY